MAQAVNTSLVSGLSYPWDIVASGSDLFVANGGAGTVGEYTTSGATVNASLISGLDNPNCLAVSGSNLFVTDFLRRHDWRVHPVRCSRERLPGIGVELSRGHCSNARRSRAGLARVVMFRHPRANWPRMAAKVKHTCKSLAIDHGPSARYTTGVGR